MAASTDRPLSGPLSIAEVARATGLTTTTLRAWQRRYGLGASEASRGGHRRYNPVDVARLRSAVQLIGQGVTTAEAARVVLAPVEHGLTISPLADPSAHHLAAAALELDGPSCRRLVRDHLQHHRAEETWQRLLRPVLSAVGDRWADLPHGIAVEHLLSHVAAAALGAATRAVGGPPTPRRSPEAAVALLACVPEEQHDLPLVALAAALSHRGVPATLLGAATPAATLALAVPRQRPAVVLLFAVLADLADPAVFDGLPDTSLLVAAGPGWVDVRLPSAARRVNDLAGAVQLIAEAVARNDAARAPTA